MNDLKYDSWTVHLHFVSVFWIRGGIVYEYTFVASLHDETRWGIEILW